jgi:hypothetical protein
MIFFYWAVTGWVSSFKNTQAMYFFLLKKIIGVSIIISAKWPKNIVWDRFPGKLTDLKHLSERDEQSHQELYLKKRTGLVNNQDTASCIGG